MSKYRDALLTFHVLSSAAHRSRTFAYRKSRDAKADAERRARQRKREERERERAAHERERQRKRDAREDLRQRERDARERQRRVEIWQKERFKKLKEENQRILANNMELMRKISKLKISEGARLFYNRRIEYLQLIDSSDYLEGKQNSIHLASLTSKADELSDKYSEYYSFPVSKYYDYLVDLDGVAPNLIFILDEFDDILDAKLSNEIRREVENTPTEDTDNQYISTGELFCSCVSNFIAKIKPSTGTRLKASDFREKVRKKLIFKKPYQDERALMMPSSPEIPELLKSKRRMNKPVIKNPPKLGWWYLFLPLSIPIILIYGVYYAYKRYEEHKFAEYEKATLKYEDDLRKYNESVLQYEKEIERRRADEKAFAVCVEEECQRRLAESNKAHRDKYNNRMVEYYKIVAMLDEYRIKKLNEISELQANINGNEDLALLLKSIVIEKFNHNNMYTVLTYIPDKLRKPIKQWNGARCVPFDDDPDSKSLHDRFAHSVPTENSACDVENNTTPVRELPMLHADDQMNDFAGWRADFKGFPWFASLEKPEWVAGYMTLIRAVDSLKPQRNSNCSRTRVSTSNPKSGTHEEQKSRTDSCDNVMRKWMTRFEQFPWQFNLEKPEWLSEMTACINQFSPKP